MPNYNIPIFRHERDANLAERIQANCSVAYYAEASFTKEIAIASADDKIKKLMSTRANTLIDDLYKIDCIMVSTGWNKNDDVFDRGETWAARLSPEDKPLNFEHKGNDIIGHIIACSPVDLDYKIISESTKEGVAIAVEELPEKYHILTSSVLYKIWQDTKLQERMDKIIAEIPKNEWFVSMEAIFSNFDYALITPKGEHIIVARNSETAFLTKHLRAYGGTGVYNGNKVGRLIRNIVFCGKGLVRNPANPDSIIFASQPEEFVGKSFATYQQFLDNSNTTGYINIVTGSNQPIQERTQMSVTVEQLQAKLDSTQKQVETLVAENATLKNETTDKLKAQVSTLSTDVKTRDEQLVAKATEISELNKKLEASAKEVEKIKAELDAAKAEVAKTKAAELKTNRISSLVSAGVEKAEAEELFDMTSAMSDEQFTKYVAKTKAAKVTPVVSTETTPVVPTPEDLNDVTPSNEPALATSGVNSDKVDAARKNISAAFKSYNGRNTK